QAMYESVKEYKGFYIARYEAGIDTQRTAQGNVTDLPGIKEGTTVYSVMGKIPYTYIPWTWNDSMSEDTNGAVEVARKMYPKTNTNYGVVSTLTYGVQWDRTLAWWLEVGAKDGKENVVTSVTDSASYGNYSNHVIAAGDLNEGAKYAAYDSDNYKLNSYQTATTSSTKASGTRWALSTGALKVANVNNIYDMAGNMWEWTMEGYSTYYRTLRGGGFVVGGSSSPVSNRVSNYPNYASSSYSFRSSLYIKK
ncbi:MAG: SUMF1/EgtB/PvdO family nonheme iron enzyme, partial [Clostridia bacterium]|nr:SUMF1/EgtB/PvdO family nonheme iron enzyme [Clostridia bacterium]